MQKYEKETCVFILKVYNYKIASFEREERKRHFVSEF
jgi:hypothetical protein